MTHDGDWHEVTIRVRYSETDAMGLLHHANYVTYFEIARTDLFRARGGDYRGMEERGFFFVVVQVECQYKRPAQYDDLLAVCVRVAKQSAAKLEHLYEIRRGPDLIAQGKTVLACVDRQGTVRRITDEILFGPPDRD